MKSRPTPFLAAAAAAVAVAVAGSLAAGSAAASEQIATKAGCAACHAASRKMVGPAWRDVAQKYKGQADAVVLLAERVRKGGKGVWGAVPMLPTDARKISDAELKAVLGWVLKTPG